MAESTQIRIDIDVKSCLEEVKEKARHLKTHSDAIDYLISYKKNTEIELKGIRMQVDQDNFVREEQLSLEAFRRNEEDITLGNKRKTVLKEVGVRLGLYDENKLIDFLLYQFDQQENFDKASLFYLADLQAGR